MTLDTCRSGRYSGVMNTAAHTEAKMEGNATKTKKSGPGSRTLSAEDAAAFPKAIRERLVKIGMKEDCVRNEVVFDLKNHNCQHITIRVRTSIACGRDEMRGCGDDAVEVSAFYRRAIEGGDELRKGVYKGTKILRTGVLAKLLDRLEERVRDAYAVSNAFAKEQQCKHPDCVAHRIARAQQKAAAGGSKDGAKEGGR